jgi:hypothetical protein
MPICTLTTGELSDQLDQREFNHAHVGPGGSG